jgi:hypothetical protein
VKSVKIDHVILKRRNPRSSGAILIYVDHLRTQLTEAMSMLNNVWYWEECPQDYKDRIEQLKEQGE